MERRPDRVFVALFSATLLLAALASAQQEAPPAAAASQQTSGQAAPEARTFSQQELDQLLAPIALYPDNLLAQILMASTYPLEVVQAARWRAANPDVKDKALEEAMQKETWDPSVKGLTAVPQVLQQMDANLGWMQRLGDAFLEQQADVMSTVQALRTKAHANGNLKSSPEMAVKTEAAENQTVYVIESTKTETIYVPTYNPAVVYGAWGYPAYPPYYMYPPAYVYPPGLTFTVGIFVGAAIWGGCGWGSNNVYINHNNYNNFNKTNIGSGNVGSGNRGEASWKHNPEHRGGVPYRDQKTADRFGQGGDNRAQSRDAFRGRDQGGGMDRGGASAGTRDMGSRDMGSRDMGSRDAGTRDMGSRDTGSRDRSSRGGGGFSGMSSGSGTRAASARGGSSFGGGGRMGGGRRR